MTLAGTFFLLCLEPATFRFVAQHLNHCATVVPGCTTLTTIILHHEVKFVFIQETAINSELIVSSNKVGGHERCGICRVIYLYVKASATESGAVVAPASTQINSESEGGRKAFFVNV